MSLGLAPKPGRAKAFCLKGWELDTQAGAWTPGRTASLGLGHPESLQSSSPHHSDDSVVTDGRSSGPSVNVIQFLIWVWKNF